MKREALTWHLRRCLQRMGWQGSLGMALFLGAGALHIFWVQPALVRLEAEESHLWETERRLRANRLQSQIAPAARLDSGALPLEHEGSFNKLLGKILDAATTAQVRLEQGQYALSVEVPGRLHRYTLSFPAKGSYPALRRFTSEAGKISGVRLESIRLMRAHVGDAGVAAQIEFSLLLKAS